MTNPQCAGIEYCSVRTDCEAGAVVDIIPQHLAAKTSNEGVNGPWKALLPLTVDEKKMTHQQPGATDRVGDFGL